MSLQSIMQWLSAEDKVIEADIEAIFEKAAPIIETAFKDASMVEPYVAIFFPELNLIPGLQAALAAMPGLIQTAQTACGPGTTAQQKLEAVLQMMQGVATQAQKVTTGGAQAWTAAEIAAVTKVVNNAVTYMKAGGQIASVLTPPAA